MPELPDSAFDPACPVPPSLIPRSRRRNRARPLVAATAAFAAALAGGALAAAPADATPASSACPVAPTSASFGYTGDTQTFTVPAGVDTLTATVAGASGGSYNIPERTFPPMFPGDEPQVYPARTIPGGAGITFSSDQVYVTPGQQLLLVVGGAGGDTTSSTGGGRGQGGGGGTFIYYASDDPMDVLMGDPYRPLIVAGGGGGSSVAQPGGDATTVRGYQAAPGGAGTSDSGGGSGSNWYGAGQDGGPGDGAGVAPTSTGGKGGQGLTSFAGGAGGTLSEHPEYSGTPGGFGGGGGGGAGSYYGGGGGGGGGYYGGGGGAGGQTNAGGVGGNSYYYQYANDVGPNRGNGWVTLSWTAPATSQVTTTFDTADGSTAPAPQTADSGCPATAPEPPTRDGYTLVGWFTARTGGTQWDFTDPVTSDQTLYAQWTPVTPATSDQTITVTSDAGTPHPGDTYTPAATSDSGLRVSTSLSPASGEVCHLTGTEVILDAPGTCEIRYNQAGDSSHSPAGQVTQQVTVTAAPTSLALDFGPSAPVFGQHLEAHVAGSDTTSGEPVDGTVSVQVNGTPLPGVTTENGAADVALATASGDPLPAGSYQVSVRLTPTAVRNAAADATSTLVIDPARTTTELTLTGSSITARVAAATPGAGTPTGGVTIRVGSDTVGRAALKHGTATLAYAVPAGARRHVAAVYSGATNWAPSSTSTVREDPTILARLTSSTPKTRSGWYRRPVIVRFSCTAHGAALVAGCPAPVRLTRSAGGQSLSRTIRAADGGVATVSVSGIDIDRTAPALRTPGVRNGGTYRAHPAATCRATDAVSGVGSCQLTRRVAARHGLTTTYAYRAVAVDRAGNQHAASGRYRLLDAVVAGAGYRHGAFHVRTGRTYTVVVHSATRPVYYDAAVYPRTPTKADKGFRKAGYHRWALGVTMDGAMRRHPLWNLGIKTRGAVHTVRVHLS